MMLMSYRRRSKCSSVLVAKAWVRYLRNADRIGWGNSPGGAIYSPFSFAFSHVLTPLSFKTWELGCTTDIVMCCLKSKLYMHLFISIH